MITIHENDVYVSAWDNGHRRVIGILDGKVCYSIGSDRNKFCKLKTFTRWVKSENAKLVHEGETE